MTITRRFAVVLILVSLLTGFPAIALQSAEAAKASIPQFVSFTGTLRGYDDRPASGVVGITFLLFEEEEGGSPLWRETQNVTLDAAGHYSVMLGAGMPYGLPPELFTAKQARWLAIEPQGLPAPARIMLLSVPYALKAGDAETIGGLPPSAFLLAGATPGMSSADSQSSPSLASPETMSGSGTTNYIPRWTPNGTTLGNSTLFQSGAGSAAKVGINTITPAATLDVNGGVIARGALQLPSKAAATATEQWASQPLTFQASAFNSSTQKAVAPKFQWQAEPLGNNTANPGGSLNLLYTTAVTPVETGLSIGGNGQIKFALGQTFPGTGKGTVTGVTAGSGLTGGGTTGSVTLGVDATKIPLLSAANTFTGKITFAAGQTFPGTLSGITAGAGLTSGGTTGDPTLSIDSAKVPLLNAANTFTAPISFVSGQTFPGTGTITGITAGTGLSGGGTSGPVTLSLNNTYSDGRYSQLGAANTFTGVQTINNKVGIGITPSYPLHVLGTIRTEGGLSLGGLTPVAIDSDGLIGGRFAILSQGNVGINNPNPKSALDVGGNINASGGITTGAGGLLNTNGGLQINGDTTLNAAPHMYLSGYVQGPQAPYSYALPIFTIPSKDILITRATAYGLSPCPSSGAVEFQIYTTAPGSQTLGLQYGLDFGAASPLVADSGALSISIPAGTQLYGYVYSPNCGSVSLEPTNLTVSIEYVMQ